MSWKILSGTINLASWFLSTPSNEPHCPSWFESESFQHSESFKDSYKSSSIIIGTSLWSSVPCIDMTSSQNYLIRLFRSFNLKNKIIWITVWNKLSLNNKMDNNVLSSVLHSSEHLWILNCNCSTRNFRILWIILHVTSVNRINAVWGNWSYKHSFCSILGSNWRTINSVGNGSWVIDPLVIKKNYFTRNIIFSLLKFIKSIDNNHWSLNITELIKLFTLRLNLPKQLRLI